MITKHFHTTMPVRPADVDFWIGIGHPPQRAEEIASCFVEYWQLRGSPHPKSYAEFCLARQLGNIPLLCEDVSRATYAERRYLPDNDPLGWCQINGHDLYSMEKAIELAITATRWRAKSKLKLYRETRESLERKHHLIRWTRLWFDTSRTPDDPKFWIVLGHNPIHARRLPRCCPEYWFRQPDRSWKSAVELAERSLQRLTAQFRAGEHRFYELVETTEYDIQKRDPVHWHLLGHNWHDSLQLMLRHIFPYGTQLCEELFRIRNLISEAGPAGELLHDGTIHLDGPLLRYQAEYELLQKQRRRSTTQHAAWPRWGPLELDSDAMAGANCCAMGPASGGTDVVLRILMQSVADTRWLVFDGRNDPLPALHAIRPPDEIHVLDPDDARSSAWDIAADAATPGQDREHVVTALLSTTHHDPSVRDASRPTLAVVIDALQEKAPGRWTLLDLIASVETPHLRTVLQDSPANIRDALLNGPHAPLVAAFLQSALQPLRPIAAAWRYASRRFSVNSWLQSNTALVLGGGFSRQDRLAPLNRILFQLVAKKLLAPELSVKSKTWLFLANLCQIGRLEPLPELLTLGPPAVTVAMTLDEVELLQRHYGAEATAILGACGNYAFLRLGNPASARWASQLLGTEKVQVLNRTESTVSGSNNHSLTLTSAEHPVVAPSAFQQLPLPVEGPGPVGFFKDLQRQVYKGTIDLQKFAANGWLREPSEGVPAFVPRPDEHSKFLRTLRPSSQTFGFLPKQSKHNQPHRTDEPLPSPADIPSVPSPPPAPQSPDSAEPTAVKRPTATTTERSRTVSKRRRKSASVDEKNLSSEESIDTRSGTPNKADKPSERVRIPRKRLWPENGDSDGRAAGTSR